MTIVYLIRHGEIAQTMPRRFVGQLDLPLTPRGRAQMVRLGKHLRPRQIDCVLTSPLIRSIESAAIICQQLPIASPIIVEELREISLGTWEGKTVAEIRQQFPGEYEARGKNIATYRPPMGESFAELQQRAWAGFTSILANRKGQRLAIVAHSGVNRVLLCQLLGMPLTHILRLSQNFGCCNEVEMNTAGCRVNTINLSFEEC